MTVPFSVLLGLLGRDAHTAAPPVPAAARDPARRWFAETGHSLGPTFGKYWDTHGGLFVSGYPITEPFQERSPIDGKVYTVQYFERARYEHHPEYAGSAAEVLLGLLGSQVVTRRATPPAATTAPRKTAVPGVPVPATAPVATAYVGGNEDFLRVRAAPDMRGAVVDYLVAGAAVGVLGPARDGWLPVAGPSWRSWASATLLQSEATAHAAPATTSLTIARDLLGAPYRYGGVTPGGFDCSGFTQFVVAAASGGKTRLPRVADDQWRAGGQPVAREALAPGDLVFFTNTYAAPAGTATHVGLYLGDGQFIHAGDEDSGVTTSALATPYWATRYLGARRWAR